MSHHIADLIVRAEAAAPAEKAEAERVCALAILELWSHRSALPQHLRPLREVEPILRTLAFLDLDPNHFRYYDTPMRQAVTANVDGDVKRAIELAMGVDYTARVLIRMFLQQAAAAAADSMEPWVELARAVGAEDGGEQKLWDFILTEDGAETMLYDGARASLEDRLGRLEAFAKAADAEAAALRERLYGVETTTS